MRALKKVIKSENSVVVMPKSHVYWNDNFIQQKQKHDNKQSTRKKPSTFLDSNHRDIVQREIENMVPWILDSINLIEQGNFPMKIVIDVFEKETSQINLSVWIEESSIQDSPGKHSYKVEIRDSYMEDLVGVYGSVHISDSHDYYFVSWNEV